MFKVIRHHLQEALRGLGKIISAKATLPILQHVRVKAEAGRVTISATDLEQLAEYRITDAEISGDTDLLVNYNRLKEFVNGGDGSAPVLIEKAEDGRVRVAYSVAGHTVERAFETLDPEGWPVFKAQYAELLPVNADIFELMRLALPSVSKEDGRKVLHGICLESDGIAATDGRHLVRLNCILPVTEPAIVPTTKFLTAGLLKQDGGLAVSNEKESSHAHFESGPWRYTVKCVEGRFPNYRQIIPDAAKLKSRVKFTEADAAALLKSLPVFEKIDGHNSVALYAGRLE